MGKEYMSGSELRQYLHISTRKMKYLMDYNYIPHQNTGQTTHKYLILRTDAEEFKHRMEHDEKLIDELSGHFSSHCKGKEREKPSPKIMLEPTEENLKAFKEYITYLWEDIPDAVSSYEAAELIGMTHQKINRLVKSGILNGANIMNKQYCSKQEIIEYICHPSKISIPVNKVVEKLVRDFMKIYKSKSKRKL